MTTTTRLPTGVPGLDEVLNGGLIENHSYLIVGAAGTGKTILSLQWLFNGKARGEKCLYVTLAEPVENVGRNVRSFGWDLEGLDILDLNPIDEQIEHSVDEYTIFPPSDVEQAPLWRGIYDKVREIAPARIVIDSVTQLRYLSPDDYQFRKQILALVTFLHRSNCTALLTYEPTELEHERSVALAVDGIIRLRSDISPHRVVGLRSVQIEKYRGSDFMSGYHPTRFFEGGIRVFPHRIEATGDYAPGGETLSSGIPPVDSLLGGGLESGTTTIISGPAGAGKSTLSVQFMRQAVLKGQKAVIYTFEEAPESIITRCRSIGMALDDVLKDGNLSIVRVNPMELYPDEFLNMIRAGVEEDGHKAVMIDSMRGYELAMEEYGSIIAHVHNLVTFLNRNAVTTLIVNEIEQITGDLVATDLGISYIVDNIVLLRYAEYRGRVIRVIACIKKRHGPLESTIREFRISSEGIYVSEELKSLRGILSGAPFSDPGEHT